VTAYEHAGLSVIGAKTLFCARSFRDDEYAQGCATAAHGRPTDTKKKARGVSRAPQLAFITVRCVLGGDDVSINP